MFHALILALATLAPGQLTDKIHYAPGDTVTLTTKNRCTLTGEVDATSTVSTSFAAAGFGGFTVTDSVTGASSIFTVSANPLDTAVGGQGGSGLWTGGTKWSTMASQLLSQNASYVELQFCTPADCMVLNWATQPGGQGYSGQGHFPENDGNMLALVQQLHAAGISVGCYTNCYPCGPAGYAWAAANRGLCLLDPFGNIAGSTGYTPSLLAGWNNAAQPALWMPISVDWRQRDAVQQATAAVVECVKHYGFDCMRWDGFYTVPGNASVNVANAVAVRQALGGLALVGNNFGQQIETDSLASVLVSGGGMYLQESGAETWQGGLAVNSIDGNWFTAANGESSYSFPSHPAFGQYTTPAINRWLLLRSGPLWDRSAAVVTTTPSVGAYVRSRRSQLDGLRYDTLFLPTPGTYQLPSTANLVTTPEGDTVNTATATVTTYGLAIWKIDDRLPSGSIVIPCNKGSTGYDSTLGTDGNQWRPSLSTSTDARGPTYPFLGFASVAPVPPANYQAVFRLWYEPAAGGCQLRLRVVDNASGQEIAVGYLHSAGVVPTAAPSQAMSGGWGYQDYRLSFSGGGNLQASVWPVGNSFGALHLAQVAFVPVNP